MGSDGDECVMQRAVSGSAGYCGGLAARSLTVPGVAIGKITRP